MSPRLDQLRADVRARAENRPGVYRMRGPSGEVLYVGKSVRVRTRLLSSFRAQRGEKAAEIIGHAHDVEWEYVPSEFAALLLLERVQAELAAPRTPSEHLAPREKLGELFERPEPRTVGLRAHEAQEVLLVARWFRLNPTELERTESASNKSIRSKMECMENGTLG